MKTRKSYLFVFLLIGILGLTLFVGKVNVFADEKIPLKILELGEPRLVGSVDVIVDKFMEQYPQYDVKVIKVPHSNYDKQLQILLRSPNPPDVFRFQMQAYLIPFVEAGFLQALDEKLSKSKILNKEKWLVSEMTERDGKTYCLPWEVQGRRIGYNKKVYQELGLTPPTTWDELMENVKKTTRDIDGDGNIDQYGWVTSLIGDMWVVSQFGNFMVMNDAYLVSKDLKTALATEEPFLETLGFWTELNRKYGVPNPNTIQHTQMAAAFGDGRAVHAVVGSWWWPDSYKAVWDPDFKYGEDWGTFINPGGPQRLKPGATKSGSNFGGWAWGLSSRSDHSEGAWKLLEFISAPEYVATYSTGLPASEALVPYKEIYNTPFFKDFIDDTMKKGETRPALRGFAQVNTVQRYLTDAIHEAVVTEKPVIEIATELQKKIQALLDE